MTINDEILETIQTIGGIFISKGIPLVPVNLEYLEERVAPGQEKLVVTQLIMHLEDLITEYYKEEKKIHKYSRYVEIFREELFGNTEGGNLIGKKRSA